MNHYIKLLQSGKTVFTIQDLAQLLNYSNTYSVRNFVYKAKQQGIINMIAYGIYALPEYNSYELATKRKKNSYVSGETILYQKDYFLIKLTTLFHRRR